MRDHENTIEMPWEENPVNRPGGTIYRAGYEEKTPQAFLSNPEHIYFPGVECPQCQEALAKYESWRLKQIRPQDESGPVTYPQAVEIIRNVLTSLPEASMRPFLYHGELRDRNWLTNVFEVVLKGAQK